MCGKESATIFRVHVASLAGSPSTLLNNRRVVRRSGSNPKLPHGTKLLLIRIAAIDERYQRTTKNKEIVYKNERLLRDNREAVKKICDE